ncbi:aconitase X catalytic domain-containing protein [Pseudooceanicola nanhaiensis]|uniref:aconitase X catalytic domain-containing protein n=1 Tax=Pseudooceanicola nanhaiensis TaxID=375761 RepID=UPI001CD7A054|nr:aconitase X catalytic domain-containing protein [Pseudooceanicola nanhaiensis]MCA0922489.1 aconitase X catalytic domain-containing protein [Pseudooceanicola nanhaiensis]
MELSDRDLALLDGAEGDAARQAMEALVQLGEAYDAPDMVEIGYAHVHAGMALYKGDVELIEATAAQGAKMVVPVSTNIANADMGDWQGTGAPEALGLLQKRAEAAHRAMGSATSFTCTPYWAGHWPTWNMHIASIESGVTVFANSVLGARSNRDGFFAVYAGMTGRYPRFGLHLDRNRQPTHRVTVTACPQGTAEFTALGYAIGAAVGSGVPLIRGLVPRPTLDDLDAMGVGMATSGGVAMFIVPGVTPPFGAEADALGLPEVEIREADIAQVFDGFCTGAEAGFDLVHLGCPHASFEEMKHYAALLTGKRVAEGVELWVTTSRAVRQMARDAGLLAPMLAAGARVVTDTCPISCHFACTCSPDPALKVTPPKLRTILVDSAKQAHYVRDMIQCPTLFTTSELAVESAVTGRFLPRRRRNG